MTTDPLELEGHCLKCGHTRGPGDCGSADVCPKCGAVYAKVRQAERAKRAAAAESFAAERLQEERVESGARSLREASELRLTRTADRRDRLLAHLVYLLFVLPLGAGLIGVIIAHVMRRTSTAGWLQTHYRWQVRTFWIGLALLLAWLFAVLLTTGFSFAYFRATGTFGGSLFWGGLSGISKLLFFAWALWALYRIVKGWVWLFRGVEVR